MRPLLLALFVFLVAGCSLGDGSDATIEQAQLKDLVLQPEDLPPEFRQFDEGRQAIADRPTGARSDPSRFGRLDGWKARYQRSARTSGPLVVVSLADVFESVDGAKEELRAIDESGFDPIDDPDVGDEARAWESLQQGSREGVRYFLIAWREDNATASVLASGFEGKVMLDDALKLARKQAARVSQAAS